MSDEIMHIRDGFIMYTSDDGGVRLNVFLQGETIWITQKMMAELFNVDRTVISKHLKNIFETEELSENLVSAKTAHTASDGKSYNTQFYNLDAIIAVGYRVNSKRATQFRIWATQVLRDYIVKGFVLNDERLRQGEKFFEQDYFQELLERVRSIRASERRIYQQITDIFAECSVDYDPKSEVTKEFYAMVQNKFHFAITGQTAAEIIHSSADRSRPHMGLTTWKHAPDGRILQADVTVAKNYLPEKDIKRLERTVTGFFDYIENVIENRTTLTMVDMATSVDKFLSFNEYKILDGKGEVSRARAEKKALAEYAEFNKTQKIESDFDREVKKLTGKPPKRDVK